MKNVKHIALLIVWFCHGLMKFPMLESNPSYQVSDDKLFMSVLESIDEFGLIPCDIFKPIKLFLAYGDTKWNGNVFLPLIINEH